MIEVKVTGSWKQDRAEGDMVSSADSGLCEMTNQRRRGIGEAGL